MGIVSHHVTVSHGLYQLAINLCQMCDFMRFAITERPITFRDNFVVSFALYKKGNSEKVSVDKARTVQSLCLITLKIG
jgi:hypothetical protein